MSAAIPIDLEAEGLAVLEEVEQRVIRLASAIIDHANRVRANPRPAVVTGPDGADRIAVRSTCYLPMTYDHRLVDGADAGRVVSAVRARLEEGAFEAELGR